MHDVHVALLKCAEKKSFFFIVIKSFIKMLKYLHEKGAKSSKNKNQTEIKPTNKKLEFKCTKTNCGFREF